MAVGGSLKENFEIQDGRQRSHEKKNSKTFFKSWCEVN
jgi:hypothetical protein